MKYKLTAQQKQHLAAVLGVSVQYVHMVFVSGKRHMGKKPAMALNKKYGIPLELIFTGTAHQQRAAYIMAEMDRKAKGDC